MSTKSVERITLDFDLFDLPTAQHKAGLAGLVLQIRSMEGEREHPIPRDEIPHIEDLTAHTVRLSFTQVSVQRLFDDLYDAYWDETFTRTKWPGTTPKREELRPVYDRESRATKDVKHFVYDVVLPRYPFLARRVEPDSPWLKLWRAMIWAIPRGINTTRVPFNERAGYKPCTEGTSAWEAIRKLNVDRNGGRSRTAPISSALLLAAQAVNAEGVPFHGRIDQNLLLHFWQVVVLVFVPRQITNDGKFESPGFVLSIPEVADLEGFCESFPRIITELGEDRKVIGFRPAAALIDLPAQAGLEFLKHLLDLASSRVQGTEIEYSVNAIESYHMVKEGNNIKLRAFERVVNRPGLIRGYEAIQKTFRNPLFRAAVLHSLLREEPWYSQMPTLFAERPWPFFVQDDATPRFIPRFGIDARAKFRAITKEIKIQKGGTVANESDRLSDIIHRLVRRYAEERTRAKTGTNLRDERFKRTKDGKTYYDPDDDFRDAWSRVCSQTFLDMRSRHDQDFIDYFVGTICSVPQFLKPVDYQFLTSVLLRKSDPNPTARPEPSWEDVKALAMIAVSACSSLYHPREQTAPRSHA